MRQRPISSVPDWTLQTAPATFFRSALTRLLQTTSSILPDEIAAPTAGSPSRVRTKPNQLRVWGHEATPRGWRSAQSTSARRRRAGLCSRFPGFQSAGWAYPFVSKLTFDVLTKVRSDSDLLRWSTAAPAVAGIDEPTGWFLRFGFVYELASSPLAGVVDGQNMQEGLRFA